MKLVMRCDNDSGWSAMREFILCNANDASAKLNEPSAQDALNWGIQRVAPDVRLVAPDLALWSDSGACHQPRCAGRAGSGLRGALPPEVAYRGGIQTNQVPRT